MDLQFRAPSITAFQTTSASCGTVTVSEPDGGDEPSPEEPPADEPMMAGVGATTLLVLVIVAAAAAYSLT